METIIKLMFSNPEMIAEIIKENSDKYKPILYSVCAEILSVMRDYASNKEVAEIDAMRKSNLFKAYIDAGFSREESMMLLVHDIGLMRNQQQAIIKQLTPLGGQL